MKAAYLCLALTAFLAAGQLTGCPEEKEPISESQKDTEMEDSTSESKGTNRDSSPISTASTTTHEKPEENAKLETATFALG